MNPAPTLTVLSTLAVMGVLQETLPDYERMAAIRVEAAFAPTRDLLKRIEDGSVGDVAILTDTAIDALIAAGTLAAGSRVDLARSFIGIAVQAGAPRPDIGTAAAFRQSLLDARSIAYSAAGASGLFFADLIERLGVADAVRAKATVIPTGFTGALAASGQVELAVQQVSELMVVPGIDIVGRLPDALHSGAIFSGGVFETSGPGAMALLRFLASDSIGPVFQRHGVEPIGSP
jgi:molybdate transport system substrate-binding protein